MSLSKSEGIKSSSVGVILSEPKLRRSGQSRGISTLALGNLAITDRWGWAPVRSSDLVMARHHCLSPP